MNRITCCRVLLACWQGVQLQQKGGQSAGHACRPRRCHARLAQHTQRRCMHARTRGLVLMTSRPEALQYVGRNALASELPTE